MFNKAIKSKISIFFICFIYRWPNLSRIKQETIKIQIERYNLWLNQLWYQLMRTLAEFNGIRDPKINLTQVFWDLNELITIEDLLQGNKTINQLDHNAYTWRRAKEVESSIKNQDWANKSRLQCWKYYQNSALKLFLKSIFILQAKTLVSLMGLT